MNFLWPKRFLIICLCAGILSFGLPLQKAKAIDPVTMGILAPIVIPYAVKVADYSVQGLTRMAPGFINAGADILNILRLPLGVLQVVLGWPFGFLGTGIHNIVRGISAPFLFIKEILSLPFYFFGLSKP